MSETAAEDKCLKQSFGHKFSLQERIELIKIFYSGKSLKQTIKVFAERHTDCHHLPTSSTITRLVRKFETTGETMEPLTDHRFHYSLIFNTEF